MTGCDVVASVLRAAGVHDVYCVAPMVGQCAEPVVCVPRKRTRDAVFADKATRNKVGVDVLVCREEVRAAWQVACECEQALRTVQWTNDDDADCTVQGMDAAMPEFKGYDGSGRALWCVGATVTIDRSA